MWEKQIGVRSFMLFPVPSFLSGAASVLDLGATLETFDRYNYSEGEGEADFCALRSDWQAVGDDLRNALEEHRRLSATM
ncbi:MAG: hypothetical protein KDK30_18890 [Leptospiraceae bacterium]|nr:hypothetical protein [Leptospiraceae bacterium]